MTTPDTLELRRKAEAVGRVEWYPGHLCRDDHPCDCAYIFDEGHASGIATIHVDNGLPISEGGNDAPSRDLAKAHQAFIAAANPAVVLALLDRLDALEGREAWKDLFADWIKAREDQARRGALALIPTSPARHHVTGKEAAFREIGAALWNSPEWLTSEIARMSAEAPTTLADEGRDQ